MVSWNKINSYQLLRYLFTITVQFIPNTFLPGQFISKQFIPRQFIPWDSSYPEQFIPGPVHTWDSSYPGTVHTLRQFIPRKFIPGDEFSGYELSWGWTVSGYELSQGMNCPGMNCFGYELFWGWTVSVRTVWGWIFWGGTVLHPWNFAYSAQICDFLRR